MNKYIVSYAQNREDIILRSFFKDKKRGFYVDVGAYDPEIDSVTKILYDKGWRGINIEPIPGAINRFNQQRTEDINIDCAASDKDEYIKLRHYNLEGLSTVSKERKKNIDDKIRDYKDVTVKAETLKTIFKEHNVKSIDFIKIDVEGHELNVLKGNDWNKYRPKLICIEKLHAQGIDQFLQSVHYKEIFFDGLNGYYIQDDSSLKFDYPTVILNLPIISNELHKQITDLKREVSLQKLELARKSDEISSFKLENSQLKNQISHMTRTKQSAKLLLSAIDKALLAQMNKIDRGGAMPLRKFRDIELPKPDKLDAKILVEKVNRWDFNNLKTRDMNFSLERSKAYRITNKLYSSTKVIIWKTATNGKSILGKRSKK